uniref:PX domain-containing protein n=1 Tax=Noctiluca scintillans TaxID=2966 RepID=A0A7S1F4Z5_NOCSC|mmetsp:Transcript_32699/g.87795  ORF Transcript_32699/g.87795 Transcript_32699/m.87795 type:complete len:578 (+) Transcript_32699:70-1803(+)
MAETDEPPAIQLQKSRLPFMVNCTGHGVHRNCTRFAFRVRHSGGCTWTTLRRHADLSALHDRLCAVFGAASLPCFPPNTSNLSFANFLRLGSATRREFMDWTMEVSLQTYLTCLCDRADVTSTACFQAALDVVPPEPVSHLRVEGWLSPLGSTTALLNIRADDQVADSSAIVDTFVVVVKQEVVTEAAEQGNDIFMPITEFATPVKDLVHVDGLTPGVQVEIEVFASNSTGRSHPVSIRIRVPHSSCAQEVPGVESESISCAGPDHAAGSVAGPPSEAELQQRQQELQRRRHEMERWWQHRQHEAECRDEERHNLMEEFLAQKQALQREREALELDRVRLDGAGSPRDSDCGSFLKRGDTQGSLVGSAPGSPRDLSALKEQATQQTEELKSVQMGERTEADLKRRLNSLRFLESKRETDLRQTEERQKKLREELVREQGVLDSLREEQRVVAAGFADEVERQLTSEGRQLLHDQEEELKKKAEYLQQVEDELRRERQELNHSRANLAVVQAHVINMLDRSSGVGVQTMSYAEEEVEEEAEEDAEARLKAVSSMDTMWSMDWNAAVAPESDLQTERQN